MAVPLKCSLCGKSYTSYVYHEPKNRNKPTDISLIIKQSNAPAVTSEYTCCPECMDAIIYVVACRQAKRAFNID